MEFTSWNEIVDRVAEAFRIDSDERERLRGSAVPKLIAAIGEVESPEMEAILTVDDALAK